jgi:hypothetical protein
MKIRRRIEIFSGVSFTTLVHLKSVMCRPIVGRQKICLDTPVC